MFFAIYFIVFGTKRINYLRRSKILKKKFARVTSARGGGKVKIYDYLLTYRAFCIKMTILYNCL